METALSGFETLEVWKEGRNFRQMMMQLCKQLPNEEKFRLVDQIKRSSRSVTANIAEGYGRFHYVDNIRFCRVARGSLNETLDHLTVALDEGCIDENSLSTYRQQFSITLKLLNGYISYLKKQKTD